MPPEDRDAASPAAGAVPFRLLLTLVLLAPLPLGSVYPLASGTIALAAGLLLLAAGVLLLAGRLDGPALGLAPWSWLAPFAAGALWAALQSASFMPAEWHNPLWAGAAAALDTTLPGAISIDPLATRAALLRLLAYAGVF